MKNEFNFKHNSNLNIELTPTTTAALKALNKKWYIDNDTKFKYIDIYNVFGIDTMLVYVDNGGENNYCLNIPIPCIQTGLYSLDKYIYELKVSVTKTSSDSKTATAEKKPRVTKTAEKKPRVTKTATETKTA